MSCTHLLLSKKSLLHAPKTWKRGVIWEGNLPPGWGYNCSANSSTSNLNCHVYSGALVRQSIASVFLRSHKNSFPRAHDLNVIAGKAAEASSERGPRARVCLLFWNASKKKYPKVPCRSTIWDTKGTCQSTKGLSPLDTSLVICLLNENDSGEHLSWMEARGEGPHLILFFSGMLGFSMGLYNSIQNPSTTIDDVWL